MRPRTLECPKCKKIKTFDLSVPPKCVCGTRLDIMVDEVAEEGER